MIHGNDKKKNMQKGLWDRDCITVRVCVCVCVMAFLFLVRTLPKPRANVLMYLEEVINIPFSPPRPCCAFSQTLMSVAAAFLSC